MRRALYDRAHVEDRRHVVQRVRSLDAARDLSRPRPERCVAPSILSADFANLVSRVREVMAAGATVIHCDVMDGHFVPPITFGPIVVSALREEFGDEIFLDVDLALIMTVNPGWGGQPFLRTQLEKVRQVRAMLGDDVPVEVDGGVNPEIAADCAEAGASWFVAGSAIFGADDPGQAFREIAAAGGCA
jgi:pentose-5-phosphate-3-epimerase